MLLDLFNNWRVDCPPWARELGLLREPQAIAKRHRRLAGAWAAHLTASRAAMLAAAARCVQRRSVLVIGAGDCLDVPVAELAVIFERVVLADIVVSANCISQLGLVPGHALPAKEQDSSLPDRCAQAAARQHLMWLARIFHTLLATKPHPVPNLFPHSRLLGISGLGARPGVRLLLADLARLNISADGREIKRESLSERYGLKQPDRQWRWNLAPIPEWSPDFHRVHEVGAWIYAG